MLLQVLVSHELNDKLFIPETFKSRLGHIKIGPCVFLALVLENSHLNAWEGQWVARKAALDVPRGCQCRSLLGRLRAK